ncbi:hypothetical protein NQ176_g706 [Zarea fungicola]|uniref:Uncharacterized protein n=1 Tax=Zarea fungicola TaxID=93591 RepID=A0ACC1NX87_9HYPO|nr:hypothetical protein NQ176_g706 [Lecanicillium fungicola]
MLEWRVRSNTHANYKPSLGIGRSMALALDANGASKVFVIGRREDKLKDVASEAINGSIIPIVGDITCKNSLQSAYEQVAAQTDYIDLLVPNSGVIGPPAGPKQGEISLSQLQNYLLDVPMEEFSDVFKVNVTGTFYSAVTFLPLLDAANSRRPPPVAGVLATPRPQIIIVSSIAGFLRVGLTGYAYHSSKAATNMLIKMLSSVLTKHNIRVNGIAPGPYYSEMSAEFYQKGGILGQGISDDSFPRTIVPLGRAGSTEDIAGMILWMAGAAGGYLNGSIIVSDGGRLGANPSSY